MKAALFRNIYRILGNRGICINADQVKGETEAIDLVYRDVWLRQVRKSGISVDDFQAARERMKTDRQGTLEDQLGFLRSSGFNEVNCWYRNFSFSVYSGRK